MDRHIGVQTVVPTRARGRVDEKSTVDNWNKGVSVQCRLELMTPSSEAENGEYPAGVARTSLETSPGRKDYL